LQQEKIMFSVGDKVMHPEYGAGQITGVEHRALMKELKHFYVIELLEPKSTLYIPTHKMDELGVRPVMSRAKLAQVLDTLRSMPRRLSQDFKERQERVREKIRAGRPIQAAEAVRDLTYRGQHNRLTKIDEALLNQGRELLATEMAMATDIKLLDAHQMIDAALEVAMMNELDELERTQEDSEVCS
jgi:CarD family transcriptional regulator